MMGQGKRIILLFMTALLALAVLCWHLDPPDPGTGGEQNTGPGFSLTVSCDGGEENLTLWQKETGEYCVFLPSYARLDQVRFRIEPGSRVFLEGEEVPDGGACSRLQPERVYQLTTTGKHTGERNLQLAVYRSGRLPAVYVDVRSGNMHYIHMHKDNEEPGTIRIYGADGQLNYSGSLESVKGRGNATWEWEKKPYNLKLRSEGELLGMGQAEQWVLLANTYDPSHLRNALVQEAARELGLAFTPEYRFVDLYLNGSYAGLYLLCEKNEIHPQRVDIDPVNGSLISIEKEDRLWEYGEEQFITDGGTPIRIRSTSDAGALQEKLLQAERAILSPEGTDPVTGKSWQELIDPESWAAKYLIEEVFGNLDAGSISQFFYWDGGDGKIFAGPVWDYDVSMGNSCNWQLQDPNMLYSGRTHLWNMTDSPWYHALYQKEAFREAVKRLYAGSMRPILSVLLEGGIESGAEFIAEAARMNRIRWNSEDPSAGAEQILAYMTERMAFLDALWLEEEPFYEVQLYINWHVMASYAIRPGETVPEQSVPDGTDTIVYLGWYDRETGEPYDFSQPVNRDMLLYLKEEGASDPVISDGGGGLSEKIKYVPAAVLLLLLPALAFVERKRTAMALQADRNRVRPEYAGREQEKK